MDMIEISIRLLTAVAMGAVIGINRDLHGKPAGLRTLAIVALGAAVFTLTALLFGEAAADAAAVSRTIQGIAAGVGFLGAGVIMRDAAEGTVHGLTTAASLWATTAVGMGCALGLWRVVVPTFALIIAILLVGGPMEKGIEAMLKRRKRDTDQQ